MTKKRIFGYRKKSLSSVLGITKAKRAWTKATGGKAIREPESVITNFKRRVQRKVGYESEPVRAVRHGLNEGEKGGCWPFKSFRRY